MKDKTSSNKSNLMPFFEKARQMRVLARATLEITSECNWRCKYCYIASHHNPGMTYDEIKKLLQELREMGTMDLILTGGEMFLRKDALDIIKLARDLHFDVSVFSNASLITKCIADKLSEMHISIFSSTIFSLDENVHDEMTQVKGSLKRAMEGVKHLKSSGVPLQLKAPITNINTYDYRSVFELCNANDIEFLSDPTVMARMDGDRTPCNF